MPSYYENVNSIEMVIESFMMDIDEYDVYNSFFGVFDEEGEGFYSMMDFLYIGLEEEI